MTRDTRKLERRLRLLGIGAAFVSVALLAGLLVSPVGSAASMPGPLTVNHALLAEDCGACHAKGLEAIQSVWHGLETTPVDLALSANCRTCHELGEDALAPHGRLDYAPEGEPGKALACNTCHREHDGRLAALTAIEEAACQSCHSEPFDAFERGHPELVDYPHARRTRLVFDHGAHVFRHFPAAEASLAPTDCTDCHFPDPSGEHMLVKGFEQTCAACHGAEIRGVTQVESAGIAFLGLPALDTFTLEERGVAIGHWPADALLTESELTPFMAFFLAADEATAADLDLLAELDLLDLTAASDEELAAVARVAWQIKELFQALGAGGHDALLVRANAALGRELSPDLAGALLEHLPEDLIRGALRDWQPRLQEELAAHREGRTPSTSSEPAGEVDLARDRGHETWVRTGGWYLHELDFLVRYRPTGHADPFLRAWLDTSGTSDRGSDLFARLSLSSSVGSCTKCHAVDEVDGARVVRWNAACGDAEGGLTRFSHVEHFATPDENACLTCHELAEDDGNYLRAFEQRDPSRFTPNFEPMSLDTCVRCHGAERASAACTTCHDYHAVAPSQALPGAALDALFSKPTSD